MTTYIPSLTLPNYLFANPSYAILLPIAAGTAVGFSTRPSETQKTYLALRQPPFRPPPWVFGPAWTVLYGLMGYASYRAWTNGVKNFDVEKVKMAKAGASLYTVQLFLNLIWMPLFFSLKRPVLATVDILALTGTVGYMTYLWGQVDEVAGWCLAPYLGWLGFATYLTVGCGYLNGWDFSDKEAQRGRDGGKGGSEATRFVDEKPKSG